MFFCHISPYLFNAVRFNQFQKDTLKYYFIIGDKMYSFLNALLVNLDSVFPDIYPIMVCSLFSLYYDSGGPNK